MGRRSKDHHKKKKSKDSIPNVDTTNKQGESVERGSPEKSVAPGHDEVCSNANEEAVLDSGQVTGACGYSDQYLTMAFNDELSHSVIHGSAEAVEFPCCLCLSKDNTEAEAEKTCIDCDYNMCAACTDMHANFPAMASHRVVDLSKTASGRSKKVLLPKERCHEHHGRILDKYCKRHDQLACDSCAGVYHLSCGKLEYIPEFAQGIKKGKDVKVVQQATKALLKDLDHIKSLQKAELNQTDIEEAQAKQMVQDLMKRLNKRVDELAKAELDKVDVRYKRKKESILKTITTVDAHMDAAEACAKRLTGVQGDNKSDLFIYMKQGEKCERDGKDVLQRINQTTKTHIPKYTLDCKIERTLDGIQSLGHFDQTVKVVGKREYIARANGEKSVCDIIDACLLPDASILITDRFNKSLKHLNPSYTVTACLNFHTFPHSLCRTNNNEVAVTFPEEEHVRFFAVGTHMEETRGFSVGDICRGISYNQGELFVCCGSLYSVSDGRVCVFDLVGSPLRTIQMDRTGEPMFTALHRIKVSSDGARIYVTDRNKGMFALDRMGKLLVSYGEPYLDSGICQLEGGGLLVSAYNSQTIHFVTEDGRRLGVVLGEQHGLTNCARTLCYDSQNSRLLISTLVSDKLNVFYIHVEG